MMTLRGRQLLAAADPWGADGLGACDALGDFGDDLLAAAKETAIGTGVTETGEGAGETLKAIEAGDFNGVVEGGKKTVAAAKGTWSAIKEGWGGAQKFFAAMGGDIDVPVFGYKQKPGKPNTIPMILLASDMPGFAGTGGHFSSPGGYSKGKYNIDWSDVTVRKVYNAKQMIDAVADGFTFVQEAWSQFGFKPPAEAPSPQLMAQFMSERLAWNPFKGQWQGGGQKITPTTPDISPATVDAAQRDVNIMGRQMGAYLSLARSRVASKAYRAASAGHIHQGQMPWGLIAMIAIMTGPLAPMIIKQGMAFTAGPYKGKTYKAQRIAWIRGLNRIVQAMPKDQRPINAGALATATDDGTPTGKPILTKTDVGAPTGAGGGAVALAAGAGLGLLWLFFA